MKKTIIFAFFTLSLTLSKVQATTVDIKLSPQFWTFELVSNPLFSGDVKLKPEERNLSKELRPLLASKSYEEALNLLTNVNHTIASAALLQLKGQVALQLNKFDLAKTAFELAVSKESALLSSHRGLAIINLKEKNNEQALVNLQKVVALGGQDGEVFAQLGYLHLQLKSPWSAVAGYRQALLLRPNNKAWQQGLLYSLVASQSYNEATALLSELLNKQPDNGDLWLHHAQLSLQQLNEKDALSSMEIALRLGNKQARNYLLAAQLHLKEGSAKRAVALFKQTLKLDTNYVKEITEATAYLIQDEQFELLRPLLKLLVTTSKNYSKSVQSNILVLQAQVVSEKQPEKALGLLSQAVSKNPNNGLALIELARAYYNKKQLIKANMYFIRAGSHAKYIEQSLIAQSQIAIEQYDYQSAVVHLRNAFKRNPSRQELMHNIKQLENLMRNQI
jgi:tetratricopeptide (TPR) repeat protein